MATVVILGCGWLGSQLGTELCKAGHQVFGSRRSLQSLTTLPAEIAPLCWDGQSAFAPELLQLLAENWLVLAMPPAAHSDGGVAYLQTLRVVLAHSQEAKGVILCSSTGVYAGLSGLVSESAAPGPDARAALLWQAEQLVMQHPRHHILRLAGLVGPGRHPSAFARRGVMAGPDQPVNLVHSTDICRWVQRLLNESAGSSPAIVNLCAPLLATKAEFYAAACAVKGLTIPQFTAATEPARRVDATLSQRDTQFRYHYADVADLIE